MTTSSPSLVELEQLLRTAVSIDIHGAVTIPQQKLLLEAAHDAIVAVLRAIEAVAKRTTEEAKVRG